MTTPNIKLPPHLRQPTEPSRTPDPDPEPAAVQEAVPVFDPSTPLPVFDPDAVTVTTPLGSVTCPPGRLKLNLLHGGMPKRGGQSDS